MAQSTPFIILVAALLISTLSYCSAESVYCVTPTATSCSSCPHNSTHCTTLSEYAKEATFYFTSNTTMVFLSGNHTLDRNITVANVARLTMHGESSSGNLATVVRNESVGISFTDMVHLNIHSLAFTSYNRSWSYGSHPASNCALLLQSTQYARLVNCSFHDNIGTALVVNTSSITLAEHNMFINNQCGCQSFSELQELGCGISAFNSNLTFTGNTTFFENNQTASYSFYCGGAIWASASSLDFNGKSNFIGNTANGTSVGGAIRAASNTSLSFNGTSNFSHNSADFGGAVVATSNVVVTFHGTNYFFNNLATTDGGAIFAIASTSVNFIGTSTFSHNSAGYAGGAINAYNNVVLIFTGTTSFSNNLAMQGGATTANLNSTLIFDGSINFINNGYRNNRYGNINGDSQGGATYLFISSTLSIMPHTTVWWENNHAHFGGAIYVSDVNPLIYCAQVAPFIQREKCFFQLPNQNLSNSIDNVQLVFKNNSADVAGSVLYGGVIDNCKLTGLDSYSSRKVFDMLFQIEDDTDYNTTSKVSSDPLRICPCENSLPECSGSQYYSVPNTVYPGETFQISVVAVGQGDGTVSSIVRSTARTNSIDSRSFNLLDYQYLQQANSTCTKLNYTVFSLSLKVNIELHPEGYLCSNPLFLVVNLNQTCPPGFNFSESARSCICEPRLAQYTNQCNITNGLGQITRHSSQHFWVGYDNQSCGLILHRHCPFDYCVNNRVVFPLNNTDVQCAYNRSGLSCGHCKKGYSLVLGTSRCKQCTSSHLALLIPFAVMGAALVFLLLVCKLTVAIGTLSGLVFYANIVADNLTIFLPGEPTNGLAVFIAWINLDFGIETCFYDGMDAHSKTWLQFVFPVYIWVLVGLMILVSHFSQRFANLLGSNPVSVLATLILLSYAKVLRTLATVGSFADLQYEDHSRRVWLYDANLNYFIGERIPLVLVALLVFLFLVLPYTLLLLFGQWLQAISHLRLFSWINSARLKPFMDSYHAPYKAKHRYWPGLLLVLRFIFVITYNPTYSLLVTVVGTVILQMWAWVSGGVYKNWYLDALEGSFVLNLILLGVATYHVNYSGGNQLAVGYTSVSIALATFVGILAYHIFQQLRHTKLWKKVPKLNLKFKKPSTKNAVDNANIPTNSPIESTNFDQLRESLLEDLPPPSHSVF